MKLRRNLIILSLVVCMLVLVIGCNNASSTDSSQVIATVNGEEIHQDTFEDWYMRTMALSFGIDMTQEMDEQTENIIETYRLSYLASYTSQKVLLQEAQKEDITVEDEKIDEYVANLQTSYGEDDEGFEEVLK